MTARSFGERSGSRALLASGLLLIALTSAVPRVRATLSPSPGLRVLIVGNSYTRFNVLPRLLQRLAGGVPGGVRLLVDAEARSGFSLRTHLRAGQALARIQSGHYSHVVLQAHSLSAVDHPAELAADTERFKRAIDAVHARTVLYETWARHPSARLYRKHPLVHSFEQMASRIDDTYAGLAFALGAQLAPIGSAFEHGLISDPEVALWGPDGSHPTLAGSFLAACVLYGSITGEDPRASSYVPLTMSAANAQLIKGLAADTLTVPHLEPTPDPANPPWCIADLP
jgi:hypothetical protein